MEMNNINNTPLPKTVFLLGYGAIGKCFVEMLLKTFPKVHLIVCDIVEIPHDPRFTYMNFKVTKENILSIFDHVGNGDVLVDLSTNIECFTIWSLCMEKGVMYMNTAMEEWAESRHPCSFPKTKEELYNTSLMYRHDQVRKLKHWNQEKGTTSVFEHGMNPGLISHFVKTGLLQAAQYFLSQRNNEEFKDLDFELIEKELKARNYVKLAQATGLHTIHCSEKDNQLIVNPPSDTKTKFYNTWSCRGFLTEGMVPIQVARGSHEDKESTEFPRIRDDTFIMSWAPSNHYWAKSWHPNGDIEGCLIPHGEAITISEFLTDKETGYSPSQYYVYDINPYAKEFIQNLPKNTTLQDCNPDMEVIHPSNHEITGYDKVGALLIFKNNRGWWAGSIMDEFDAVLQFDYKFGPTVLQVTGGVFSAFVWMCNNPGKGNKWAEDLDSEFVIDVAAPFLGRIYSKFVDLRKTHIKDCYKFESFVTKKY